MFRSRLTASRMALVTDGPIYRDLNKIYRQNVVHYIRSRATIAVEELGCELEDTAFESHQRQEIFLNSKTPRPAVGPVEPLVSKMGTGVLPQG